MKLYRGPGPHKIDEATAAAARSEDLSWLHVIESDEPPRVIEDDHSGILTSDDFKPRKEPDAVAETPFTPIPFAAPGANGRIACSVDECFKDFASEASLARHIEQTHGLGA